MKNKLTEEYINALSYPDFVGLINQWNVSPGAFSTLSKWAKFSDLDHSSRLLEVACTTGFSSRELSAMTGCAGVGFDISLKAIEKAEENKKIYAPNIDFRYIHSDGHKFESDKKFTHIVVGASLKFFPDPQKMFDRCLAHLEDNGYVLASPFYAIKPIPKHLIAEAKKIFGFEITTTTYKETMDMYNKLEILFEERNSIVSETNKEIAYYCKSTIDRAVHNLKIKNDKIYNLMYSRLYAIKEMSNKLRPYQNYAVLVLRYRKAVYPNRFVELF